MCGKGTQLPTSSDLQCVRIMCPSRSCRAVLRRREFVYIPSPGASSELHLPVMGWQVESSTYFGDSLLRHREGSMTSIKALLINTSYDMMFFSEILSGHGNGLLPPYSTSSITLMIFFLLYTEFQQCLSLCFLVGFITSSCISTQCVDVLMCC